MSITISLLWMFKRTVIAESPRVVIELSHWVLDPYICFSLPAKRIAEFFLLSFLRQLRKSPRDFVLRTSPWQCHELRLRR